MEHISVAGHPEPVPASAAAERMLRDRLDAAREARGDAAAGQLEELVGKRIGTLLAGGAPNIDVATMRAIVEYVELPLEEENTSAMTRLKERLSRRGGPAQ